MYALQLLPVRPPQWHRRTIFSVGSYLRHRPASRAALAAALALLAFVLRVAPGFPRGLSFSLAPVAPPAGLSRPRGGGALELEGWTGGADFPESLAVPHAKRRLSWPSAVGAAVAAAAGLAALRAPTSPWAGERRGHPAARCGRTGLRAPLALRALPEAADFAHQAAAHAQGWWHAGGADAAAPALHAAGEALRQGAASLQAAGAHALELWPAAHAADAPAAAAAAPVLDPNVKYVLGDDGNVLLDPMNNKPIPDDWWNQFIGAQAQVLKAIDGQLRAQGVPQAFGWAVVAYTALIKLILYPLQQSQLRSTSMMQLLSPKVKEIQDKYKDDPETMQRLLAQLYSVMDVNPLGGCLPVLLQLPIYWSLYGVWRRLSAEHFQYYEEPWLWVPSLAKPNPDFQFKIDWLLQFKDGAPVMGWHDYLSYLVFPVLLVGFTVVSQLQAQAARPKTGSDDSQQLILQVLPWISVYFIGSLALELPQAVSLYYSVNTGLSLAQTALVKFTLRREIPGYEEFEKTGKFPDGAFEDMVKASTPVPKTLHEAALRGDNQVMESLLDTGLDIDAWDEKQIAPLGYAVATGQLSTVQLLIRRGANVQVVDGQDNTLLHYACGYGHKQVLQELLEQDAFKDPSKWKELRNKRNQTCLDAARVNRKGLLLDFLRESFGLEPEPPAAEGAASEPATQPSPAAAAARAALLAAAQADAATGTGAEAAVGVSKAAAGSAAPARVVD